MRSRWGAAVLVMAAAAGAAVASRAPDPDPGDTRVTARPAGAALSARTTDPARTPPPSADAGAGIVAPRLDQGFPYYPYDARVTFVRIQPKGGGFGGGFGRRSREPPWAHDYPSAEHNLSKILKELTFIRARVEDWGGNILTLDDPRLMQFPVAYMSEPGYWSVTPEEAEAMREYMLKGGFVIFDDFGGYRDQGDLYNLAAQMERVLPELTWVRLDATADIFDSFFELDPDNLQLASSGASYRGTPVFYGLFQDNDPEKRLMAIGADGGDFGEFWEFSDRGYYPVDISNEAYKVGINYLIYALTH